MVFWASFEPCENAIHAAESSCARPKMRVTAAGNAFANKLSISTARPGESTRVATTVAIALAVSWKPLMKSNVRPSARMRRRTNRSRLGVSSGILERDIAQDGGDGLGFIGRVLEQLVEVVPAH